VETVCLRDVERAGRLVAELVSRLDAPFAASLSMPDAFAPVSLEPAPGGAPASGTGGAPAGGTAASGPAAEAR
jgi:hypothetical protein